MKEKHASEGCVLFIDVDIVHDDAVVEAHVRADLAVLANHAGLDQGALRHASALADDAVARNLRQQVSDG